MERQCGRKDFYDYGRHCPYPANFYESNEWWCGFHAPSKIIARYMRHKKKKTRREAGGK
jgi:hypothetical protein